MTLAPIALAGALFLAGCGSSPKKVEAPLRVSGQGFHFSAPAGWPVRRAGSQVTVGSGSALVQVSTFPLVKAYDPSLFTAVAGELAVRMRALAAGEKGRVDGTSTVVVAGIRAHVWRIAVGDHVDEYTFVLTRRREFQLLCRRLPHGDDAPCLQLVQTFVLG